MAKITPAISKQGNIKSRIRQMLKKQMDFRIYDETVSNFKTKIYNVKLQRHSYMTDPVAMFRPQTLYSWYGTVKHIPSGQTYQVFFIAGTDEGMWDAEIFVEPTIQDIKRMLWSGWRATSYGYVRKLIPSKYKRK